MSKGYTISTEDTYKAVIDTEFYKNYAQSILFNDIDEKLKNYALSIEQLSKVKLGAERALFHYMSWKETLGLTNPPPGSISKPDMDELIERIGKLAAILERTVPNAIAWIEPQGTEGTLNPKKLRAIEESAKVYRDMPHETPETNARWHALFYIIHGAINSVGWNPPNKKQVDPKVETLVKELILVLKNYGVPFASYGTSSGQNNKFRTEARRLMRIIGDPNSTETREDMNFQ